MQNKANFQDSQVNVSANMTRDYERISNPTLGENKPNSKPISQKPKINVNSIVIKDYEDICPCGAPKNKPKTNPIPQKVKMSVNFFVTKDYQNQPPEPSGKQTQSNPISKSVSVNLRATRLRWTKSVCKFIHSLYTVRLY